MEIDPFIFRVSIFILSIFIGYYVVWSVTPSLHTPLMSVTNAISSVIIVGAIISKDFDEESDAAFNGGIAGLAGTLLMVIITSIFLVAAVAVVDEDSDSDVDSTDNSSDDSDGDFTELITFAVKGLLPSGMGGAIGAFAGYRFLWSKMPSSEINSAMSVVAQPIVYESVEIECPSCQSKMVVQKLGKLQNVICQNCGTEGQIKI